MILETDFLFVTVARSSEKILDMCIFILGITKTWKSCYRKIAKSRKFQLKSILVSEIF